MYQSNVEWRLILAVQGGWRGDWGVGWVWDKRLEHGQASSCCKCPVQVKPSAGGEDKAGARNKLWRLLV